MVRVKQSGGYSTLLEDLCLENEDLEKLIEQKVNLFKKNPNDTRLKNHPLTKRMKGKWAFNITEDIRIVYKWVGKTTVRFLAIGRHAQVYTKS